MLDWNLNNLSFEVVGPLRLDEDIMKDISDSHDPMDVDQEGYGLS